MDDDLRRPAKPDIDSTGALRRLLIVGAAAIVLYVVGSLVHNFVYSTWQVEEPVFLLLAIIVAPVMFMISLVGCSILLIRRLTRD